MLSKSTIQPGLSVLFTLLATLSLQAQDARPPVYDPYPATIPVNYIRTWDALSPDTNATLLKSKTRREVLQTTAYADGLGRPWQTVVKQGALIPGATTPVDLINAKVYDEYGREVRAYLPFATTNTKGAIVLNPFEQQQQFYSDDNINSPIKGQGETFYYGKTEYESSPLNRVERTYAAGNSWVNQGNGTQVKYWVNTAVDAVRIWNVADQAGAFGSYTTTDIYPDGVLSKIITVDEKGKQVAEFKDKLGHTILKKVQLEDAVTDAGLGSDHDGWLCTYYIYDDYNLLRAVVQPEGVKLLKLNNWDITALNGDILNEQCFRYAYDKRDRMIIKKVPGAGIVQMVYDTRDRLVLTHDASMAQSSQMQWMVTTYDELNRPLATYKITDAAHYNDAAYYRDNPSYLASLLSSLSENDLLTEAHYDDYSGIPASFYTTSLYPSGYDAYLATATEEYGDALTLATTVRGRVTWTRTRVLEKNKFIVSCNLYDAKGRVIQTQVMNYTDAMDVITNRYSFSGQLLRSHIKHQKGGANALSVEVATKNTYDDLGRLITIEKNLNGTGWKAITSLTYDALGQVKTKKLSPSFNSNAGIETLTYDYNIRGWLLGANRDYTKNASSTTDHYFGFDLGYDKPTIGSLGAYDAAQYNGNITGTVWKSRGSGQVRKYDFTYDNVNRLTGAGFKQYASAFDLSAGVDFSVSNLTYDANGNIKSMDQKGLKITASQPVDQLAYHYKPNSNKLLNVVDGINDPATVLGDFRASQSYMTALGNTKTDAAVDYDYDLNGNLKQDKNKDITAITYNYLNLPQTITVKDKGSIEYVYDAAGSKIEKVVRENNQPEKHTLYLFGTYENDVLQFLPQEEGRIRFTPPTGAATAGVYNWDYFIKDHLGNVRMVLTEEQKTDPYHAGMEEAKRTAEVALFGDKITTTLSPKPGGFDSDSSNHYVSVVNGTTAEGRVGPGVILKVMAGDKIYANGWAWYLPTGMDNSTNQALTTSMVASILGQLTPGIAGVAHGTVAGQATNGILQPGMDALLTRQTATSGAPKAFLNWVALDGEQLKYVDGNIGATPVLAITGTQEKQLLQANGGGAIEIKKNGYIYVYVSNESKGNVYFDDIHVDQVHGPLSEETHYYPFGLTMAGVSSKAAVFGDPGSKMKYNGKEEQRKEFSDGSGLEWLDYGARMYDAQIGRWTRVDNRSELYQNLSPYAYAANQPTNAIDPDGNLIIFINGMHLNDGGTSDYWRDIRSVENGIVMHAFDHSVMKHFGDYHRIDEGLQYIDGTMGGAGTTVQSLYNPLTPNTGNLWSNDREDAGYGKGEEDAAVILASLHRTNGVIDETLKIITHSMGGSFAKGYVRAIIEYAKAHPEISNGLRISEFDFDPYQAGDLSVEPFVHTEQYTHNGKKRSRWWKFWNKDRIADEKQEGIEADNPTGDNNKYWESKGGTNHSIFTFFENISQLEEGTYVLVNGSWVKQN